MTYIPLSTIREWKREWLSRYKDNLVSMEWEEYYQYKKLQSENAALRQRVQELEAYASDTDFDRNDMARQINEANARVAELEALLPGADSKPFMTDEEAEEIFGGVA